MHANTFRGSGVESKIMPNQHLAEELHKLIIRKFEKQKVDSSSIDNICGAHLADMQLINKFNKWFRFLFRFSFIVNMYGLFFWKIKNYHNY